MAAKQQATSRQIVRHWAYHLKFVSENHTDSSWLDHVDNYREWLDMYIAESDDPVGNLRIAQKAWPQFEASMHLVRAIEDAKVPA